MLHRAGTQKSRYCGYCRRRVMCEQQMVSFAHAIMMVLTCGLWLPVLIYKFANPKFRCRYCGEEV